MRIRDTRYEIRVQKHPPSLPLPLSPFLPLSLSPFLPFPPSPLRRQCHHRHHYQHPRERRQRAQSELRLAQQLAPAAQSQVVERRVDIARRALQNSRDRTLAEAGTVALVVPEGLRLQQVEAGEGGQQQHKHGRGQQSSGVAHRSSRGARARNRLKNNTAAPTVNRPGRARIQSYFQPGMGDRSGTAVA